MLLGSKNTLHNNYQDFQAFLDAGGKIGLQHDPLLYGAYLLNPFLVRVEMVPMLVVNQGEVAVMKAYVGLPTLDTSGAEFKFGSIVRPGHRGIWQEPLRTGKYPINPRVYAAEIVPTSILTLNWANAVSTAHNLDAHLSPIEAKSREGFVFRIDLQVQIHVPDTRAPKVISMVGTMQNLVNEVLQAAVGNHFRNTLQSLEAVRFIETRAQVQESAFEAITAYLDAYDVETRGVYIQDVEFPEELVDGADPARDREPGEGDVRRAGARADGARRAWRRRRAPPTCRRSSRQSAVGIGIQDNEAQAREAQARGEAAYVELTGKAEATKTEAIGLAEAKATEALGLARAAGFEAQTRGARPDRHRARRGRQRGGRRAHHGGARGARGRRGRRARRAGRHAHAHARHRRRRSARPPQEKVAGRRRRRGARRRPSKQRPTSRPPELTHRTGVTKVVHGRLCDAGSVLAEDFAPGDAFVDAGLAGEAEHTLADDVLHHLVGAAGDVRGGCAEERLVPAVVVVAAGDGADARRGRSRARPSRSSSGRRRACRSSLRGPGTWPLSAAVSVRIDGELLRCGSSCRGRRAAGGSSGSVLTPRRAREIDEVVHRAAAAAAAARADRDPLVHERGDRDGPAFVARRRARDRPERARRRRTLR